MPRTHFLAADHPAWVDRADLPVGAKARVVRCDDAIWAAGFSPAHGLELSCVSGEEGAKPVVHTTVADDLPAAAPAALTAPLRAMGWATRIPNPSLWDAVSTAVLRQVIQAAQARKVYRAWCSAYGTAVETAYGPLAVGPAPERVLELSEAQFKAVGAAFHRTALQAAAAAYLRHAPRWASLAPADLAAALDDVPRIGPWTAAAAASDYTGEFAAYPHDDLAVRTWAARIAPDYPWPDDARAFGALWRGWAANARELHALTLLTLAWGSTHVEHRPHGGTPVTD